MVRNLLPTVVVAVYLRLLRSFHALDSQGHIYVWGKVIPSFLMPLFVTFVGVLRGTMGALRSDGYSLPFKRTEGPMRLRLPVKIRSIRYDMYVSLAQ